MGKTFAEAAASYIQYGGERKYLHKIVNEIGEKLLHEIVPFEITITVKQLFPTLSNASLNRMAVTPISAVLNHAHQRGWGPAVKIKRFKVNRPVPKKAASLAWIHAFIRQCDKDNLPHVAALVLFMSQTGARVSEAIQLKWPDVDLQNHTVLLRKLKCDTNSIRCITNQLADRIYKMQQSGNVKERVFKFKCRYSVNERIAAVCQRAGISYKSSHMCGRHAMANIALELGVGIKSTMIAGGWKSASAFLETYVNPRESGRLVADKFNSYHYDADL